MCSCRLCQSCHPLFAHLEEAAFAFCDEEQHGSSQLGENLKIEEAAGRRPGRRSSGGRGRGAGVWWRVAVVGRGGAWWGVVAVEGKKTAGDWGVTMLELRPKAGDRVSLTADLEARTGTDTPKFDPTASSGTSSSAPPPGDIEIILPPGPPGQ